jgi:hypothetical protein
MKLIGNDLLPCDRTVKNELHRLSCDMRKKVKHILVQAAKNKALTISPDIWTDNHRRISYMGATAHFIDEELTYQSIDLFCVEFAEAKKTAEHLYEVSQIIKAKFSH